MSENKRRGGKPDWILMPLVLSLAVLITAGCGGGGGSTGPSLTQLTVGALYPVHGSGWNDYVKNDAPSVFIASGAAATGSETGGYSAVLHGGEMRAVNVTGKSSCAGLTVQEDLGAFDWSCVEGSNPVRMVSTGLADGKHLSDLIDFSAGAWRRNKVTVYASGTAYGASSLAAWWSNPVVVDNNGSDGTDMRSGDIRIVSSNPHATYVVGASHVALVVNPAVTMTGSATTQETVVKASGKSFLWFEGTIDADGDNLGVYWDTVNFSVLNHVRVVNANNGVATAGVVLSASSFNLVRDISTWNTKGTGFALWTGSNYNDVRDVRCATDGWLDMIEVSESQHNYLQDIVAVQSRQGGLYLWRASNNTLVNVVANNNHSFGIDVGEGSSNNTLVSVTVANNGANGFTIYWASLDNVVVNLTAANNGDSGVDYFGDTSGPTPALPTNNVLMNAVAVNNNYGFYLSRNANNNRFVNIAATNQSLGIRLDTIGGSTFSGVLRVGNNGAGNCSVTGGVNPGLFNGTCANNASSTAVLTTGVSLAGAFMAKVVVNDVQNPNDTNGAAIFSAISDWTSFENPLRMWGLEGTAAFPHVSQADYCGAGGTSDNCRIWDWSLKTGDTGDAGRPSVLGVLALPTGNDTFVHTWSNLSTTTALRNAVEVLGGGVGNGNGLCESGETCLYTPNIGSYQGHGGLVSAGTFVNGAITGVTLLRYEFNGR